MTAIACVLVSACGGSGSGSTGNSTGSSADATTQTTEAKAAVQTQAQKEADAGRLAKQATFGPTPDLISHIVSIGVSAWLDEQFAASGSTYSDIASSTEVNVGNFCAAAANSSQCQYHYGSRQPVAMRFYADAMSQPDQLRQRVALALSQLLVASVDGTASGMAGFNQIFLDNAFGNYRDILSQVTYSGYMGAFLSMAGNGQVAPNENYAREFMQLFSMGPVKLNMDGSQALSSSGQPIANYTPDDIHNAARALTGWVYAPVSGGGSAFDKAMVVDNNAYDSGAKSFLGVAVPAGASPQTSVDTLVNAGFNNASTPPFVAKFLIQQLVTSNPTPAYVARVAAVFVNDGSNVRGNMKAVVRAILMDSEARNATTGTSGGKVKEPILLMTSLGRVAGMVTDGYPLTIRDGDMGEAVFRAPSVFNFYPPSYPLPQSSTLVSPSSKLLTIGTTLQRHNMAYEWMVLGDPSFPANAQVLGATGTTLNWSYWEGISDVATLVDRIDLLMLNRTITAAQKTALTNAANAITDPNATTQARKRAQMLIYIVGTSPFFQVDR